MLLLSLIWKEPHYDKLQVSQSAKRLLQCLRLLSVFIEDFVQFHNSKVGFLASVRMTWLFRPDAHQTSNIRPYDVIFPSGLL
jgi:hypothetical protein